MRDLGDLGREVRAEQDRELAQLDTVSVARRRFLARPFGQRRRTLQAVVALAAAAMIAFGGFSLWSARTRSLAFSVGGEPFASTAGRRVTAPLD